MMRFAHSILLFIASFSTLAQPHLTSTAPPIFARSSLRAMGYAHPVASTSTSELPVL